MRAVRLREFVLDDALVAVTASAISSFMAWRCVSAGQCGQAAVSSSVECLNAIVPDSR